MGLPAVLGLWFAAAGLGTGLSVCLERDGEGAAHGANEVVAVPDAIEL